MKKVISVFTFMLITSSSVFAMGGLTDGTLYAEDNTTLEEPLTTTQDDSDIQSEETEISPELEEFITELEAAVEAGEITEEEAGDLLEEAYASLEGDSEASFQEEVSSEVQKKAYINPNRGFSKLTYNISVLKTFPGAIEQRGMTFLSFKSKKYLSKYINCKDSQNGKIGNKLRSLKLRMGAVKPICKQEVTYQYLPYRTYRKSNR